MISFIEVIWAMLINSEINSKQTARICKSTKRKNLWNGTIKDAHRNFHLFLPVNVQVITINFGNSKILSMFNTIKLRYTTLNFSNIIVKKILHIYLLPVIISVGFNKRIDNMTNEKNFFLETSNWSSRIFHVISNSTFDNKNSCIFVVFHLVELIYFAFLLKLNHLSYCVHDYIANNFYFIIFWKSSNNFLAFGHWKFIYMWPFVYKYKICFIYNCLRNNFCLNIIFSIEGLSFIINWTTESSQD